MNLSILWAILGMSILSCVHMFEKIFFNYVYMNYYISLQLWAEGTGASQSLLGSEQT